MKTMFSALIILSCLSAVPAFADDSVGSVGGTVKAIPPKFLPETVVYLVNVPGKYEHKAASMDQLGMVFIPHVLSIMAGDTVTFMNNDSMVHDIFSPDNETYSIGSMKNGETRSYQFTKENVAYTQLCHFHPDMFAYIFVGQNPFSAIPDKSGHFSISNIPSGAYQIAVWNSTLKAADQKVTISKDAPAKIDFLLKR